VIPHGAAVSKAPCVWRTPKSGPDCSPGDSSVRVRASSGRSTRWRCSTDLRPRPIYVVAGKHPPKCTSTRRRVPRHVDATREGTVHVDVVFDPEYRSLASLAQLISESTMVHPALRLAGPGDVGRIGRRHRGRSSGDRHGLFLTPWSCSRAAPAWWCRATTPKRWPTPFASPHDARAGRGDGE